ncbi:MAG: hypothetical protein WC968_00050 [Bacilli bacterium]
MKKKNKNVSKKIKNGTTLQTRDEYLGNSKYIKKEHPSKNDLYRKVVVVDSNKNDELAIVKLTTKGGHGLPNYKKGKSTYKAFVETESNGKKIIVDNNRFVKNKTNDHLSKEDVVEIKKNVFKNSKSSKLNRKKIRVLKGRKKGTT